MSGVGAGWRVTIDQISGAGGRARFEYTSSSSSSLELAIAGALQEARLTEVIAGQYQITAVPSSSSVSSSSSAHPQPQPQLGVCPHCGKFEAVTPSIAHPDQLTCWQPSGGCGALWRGARLGVPQ